MTARAVLVWDLYEIAYARVFHRRYVPLLDRKRRLGDLKFAFFWLGVI